MAPQYPTQGENHGYNAMRVNVREMRLERDNDGRVCSVREFIVDIPAAPRMR
jgi:hypothetical protein